MTKLNLSNYEKLLYTIVENALYKITSAIELYCTKIAYNEAYFLAVIAEEELAKLIMIPIARELNEMETFTSNKKSKYFKHPIKQQIFTSFGLQNRKHEDIEALKQECLYVGITKDLNPKFIKVKPKIAYNEIKHATQLFAQSVVNIMSERTLSEDLRKKVHSLLFILDKCIQAELPGWKEGINGILDGEERILAEIRREDEQGRIKFHKELFTNPFQLIRLFKNIYNNDYKKHLRKIKDLPFHDIVIYVKKKLGK